MAQQYSALSSLLVYESDESSSSAEDEGNEDSEKISDYEPTNEFPMRIAGVKSNNDYNVLTHNTLKDSIMENFDSRRSEIAIYSKDSEASDNDQNSLSEPLPLPASVVNMFKDTLHNIPVDVPVQYSGKIRSFAHEKGVWATFVYIKYCPDPGFIELLDDLIHVTEQHGISLSRNDSFHISLSKTVKLRHHWIQPFIDTLKVHLVRFQKFKVMLQSIEVYTNEESTRTFLGFKVHFGMEYLEKLVKQIDKCLQEYKLPIFYEDPSFHLSGAYCVGNFENKMLDIMSDLNVSFQTHLEKTPCCRTMWVSQVYCKAGNKLFSIPLKS